MKSKPFNKKDGTGDCWVDVVSVDQTLIERNKCPKCKRKLIYKGFSNITWYFAFGICEACEYAKLFWSNSVAAAGAKKRLSGQTAKAESQA